MTDAPPGADESLSDKQLVLLCGSVFIIAACSLVYELLISSLSTYLLGSSVVHYSLTIGLFLFFMGVGAWAAQSVVRDLVGAFVAIEIAIGVAGGVSALLLFAVYAWTEYYYPAMLLVIAVIGVLIGMELPLLTRILERHSGLRRGISLVLAWDYLGALVASLLFPFVLLPYLGHLLTAVAVGVVNLSIALLVAWHFRQRLGAWRQSVRLGSITAVLVLLIVAIKANPLAEFLEHSLYEDPVVHSEQSLYQKIVVTRRGDDLRLYLDGNLQFSSVDEYRYHEVLAHVPAAFSAQRASALIIGGGDGLAARELLRYPEMEKIVIVDLDPAVTQLGQSLPMLSALNAGSLADSRVRIVNQDAWQWLGQQGDLFDLVLIDLPDPEHEAIARLYTVAFYQRVARRLAVGGVMITQATSPWFARRAFWSIGTTLEEVFESVRPVQSLVPSFGLWGFFIAARHDLSQTLHPPFDSRFFGVETLQQVLAAQSDLPRLDVKANRSQSLPILDYYREGWEMLNLASPVETGAED
jgi:spermidine synthase